jgi:hypothetical protein
MRSSDFGIILGAFVASLVASANHSHSEPAQQHLTAQLSPDGKARRGVEERRVEERQDQSESPSTPAEAAAQPRSRFRGDDTDIAPELGVAEMTLRCGYAWSCEGKSDGTSNTVFADVQSRACSRSRKIPSILEIAAQVRSLAKTKGWNVEFECVDHGLAGMSDERPGGPSVEEVIARLRAEQARDEAAKIEAEITGRQTVQFEAQSEDLKVYLRVKKY